jgi:hypothetical protein
MKDMNPTKTDILLDSLAEYVETILPTRGISMGKTWAQADHLVIGPLNHEPAAWGSVIVCRAGDGLVAHRVVRRFKRHGRYAYVTKGDGYLRPDRWPVVSSEVMGIVVARMRQDTRLSVHQGWPRLVGLFHAGVGWLGSWLWRPLSR